jgi:hypothetical protein
MGCQDARRAASPGSGRAHDGVATKAVPAWPDVLKNLHYYWLSACREEDKPIAGSSGKGYGSTGHFDPFAGFSSSMKKLAGILKRIKLTCH